MQDNLCLLCMEIVKSGDHFLVIPVLTNNDGSKKNFILHTDCITKFLLELEKRVNKLEELVNQKRGEN